MRRSRRPLPQSVLLSSNAALRYNAARIYGEMGDRHSPVAELATGSGYSVVTLSAID